MDKAVVNAGNGCGGSLGGGHTASDSGNKLHFHDSESVVKGSESVVKGSESVVKVDPTTKQ
jgi:hypothetical protein